MAPNIFSPRFDEDVAGRFRRARLGRQAGAARLGVSLYELSAAWKRGAYHCHYGNEELLVARSATEVMVRPAAAADAHACGRVLHAAFGIINERHGFETRWPSVDFAAEFARDFIARPGIYAVVAQHAGKIVGCSFLDERGEVCGVGPTAVLPSAQARGVGRALMEDALSRAADATSVRLLQDAFNTTSLGLYATLGFEVKEPIALMRGTPSDQLPGSHEVRPARGEDLDACAHLCRGVHGFDRATEVRDAMEAGTPLVAVREGRVVAYASGFGTLAHAVAEGEEDMRALILGALGTTERSLEFLLPTRQAGLFRWCLDQGLRVVKPMTLMARGRYEDPDGFWCPTVLY